MKNVIWTDAAIELLFEAVKEKFGTAEQLGYRVPTSAAWQSFNIQFGSLVGAEGSGPEMQVHLALRAARGAEWTWTGNRHGTSDIARVIRNLHFALKTGFLKETDLQVRPVDEPFKIETGVPLPWEPYVERVIAALRTLHWLDAKMHYGRFSKVIGLREEDGDWSRIRHLLSTILDETMTRLYREGDDLYLELDRIVDKSTGEAGEGFARRRAELEAGSPFVLVKRSGLPGLGRELNENGRVFAVD